jgi:hypothetical protein
VKETIMKTVVSALLAFGLLAGTVAEGDAAVCGAGPYRAGCAGPRGAVVTHRPYGNGGAAVVRPGYGGAAVVRPGYGVHCYYRYGRRICT